MENHQATNETVLELQNVCAGYGKLRALHGASMQVRRGEIVALLGANGAGKSTILRAISGLIPVESGSILWQGRDVKGLRPQDILRAGLAHCPEERHVWPEMTVDENLKLGAYLVSSKAEIARRTEIAFERFPRMKERRRQLAGTLSGGEQQMLAIARALMSEPTLLMMDEPSLGLSPKLAVDVFEVIRDISRSGLTVVLVEQNVHNALAVASRAYVVETGRVVAEREAGDLASDPEILSAYLGV